MNVQAYWPDGSAGERVAAVVGLVSDTHFPQRCRRLPPALFDVLAGVDLLLHAGDVGELRVLDDLSRIAPVVAVHGNDETDEAQRELPYQQVVAVAGTRIFLWHSHYPDPEAERASRIGDDILPKLARTVTAARQAGAPLAVFGHWHIPLVQQVDGVTLVNPGALASGNEFTRQLTQSVALLLLLQDGGRRIVHIDLAEPERPFDPAVDAQAGFEATLQRFSASILTPELRALAPALQASLTPAEFERVRHAVAKLAHRCWAGELPLLDRELVWAQLAQDEDVPESVRVKVANSLGRTV